MPTQKAYFSPHFSVFCVYLLAFNKKTPPGALHQGATAFLVLAVWGFFDKLPEVKEAPKTSNATPTCIGILEWGALRSKPKPLAQQAFAHGDLCDLLVAPNNLIQ